MTHRHLGASYPIGQTGHADLVQTPKRDWWAVMLAKRKVDGFVTLARETFLAKVIMTQQESGITPIFNPGIGLLKEKQKRPDLPWNPVPKIPERDDFDKNSLDLEWNFLRTPQYEWYNQNDGQLEIKLRPEMVTELVNPSFIAKRTRHFNYEVVTKLSFHTKKDNEKSGLVIYRRHGNNYQLLKGKDEIILLKVFQKGNKEEFKPKIVASATCKDKEIVLKAKIEGLKVQFFFGKSENNLTPIGDVQDYTLVSDEIAQKFNGVYVGLYATSSGIISKNISKFDWFIYKGN